MPCCVLVWLSEWVQFDCATTVMWTIVKWRHACVFRPTAVSSSSPPGWGLVTTLFSELFLIPGKVFDSFSFNLLLKMSCTFAPAGTEKLSNSLAMSLTLLLLSNFLCGPALFRTTPLSSLNGLFSSFLARTLTRAYTYIHTHFLSLSSYLPSSCLPPRPPPWVIVVFRVRQEPQSLRPPLCLPGSAAANLRQLVWPNRLKQLWKTALAAPKPLHPPPSQRKSRI